MQDPGCELPRISLLGNSVNSVGCSIKETTVRSVAVADRYCRNCGQELRRDDHFCPSCGRPVHETGHVPPFEANVPVPPPPQETEAAAQDAQRPLVRLRRFLLEVVVPVLGSVAGLVVGLSALTYGLGLLALWIPISTTYTDDLASAWYAASLPPNTMVAGVGVSAVARALVTHVEQLTWVAAGVLVGMGALAVWHRLISRWRKHRRSRNSGVEAKQPPAEQAGDGARTSFKTLLRHSWGMWVTRNTLLALVVWFSFFYVIAVVQVAKSAPPLPQVEITGDSALEGKLLTHTDSFWYVFHRDEKKQPWRLVAVPDNKVKTVEVYSEGT